MSQEGPKVIQFSGDLPHDFWHSEFFQQAHVTLVSERGRILIAFSSFGPDGKRERVRIYLSNQDSSMFLNPSC